MFCMNCGTQLPEEARFCWKCGEPQAGGPSPDTRRLGTLPPHPVALDPGGEPTEPAWEICTIVHEIVEPGSPISRTQDKYWARAIGPDGEYNAGETPTMQYLYSRSIGRIVSPLGAKRRAAYHALVDEL